MTQTCRCGYETTNGGVMTNHTSRCVGPEPTLQDLYRVGKVTVSRSGCHLWNGRRNIAGYGVLPPIAARQLGEELAHRAMLVITCGAIPDDHIGLHDCDNPPCVNPEAGHVRIGTRSENTLAIVERGRHPWVRR